MTRMKLAGIAALGLALAVLGGYLWGASGRWQIAADLADCERTRSVDQARRHLLQARLELFSLNFGAATRELEAAKPALEEAARQQERAGQRESAGLVREVIPVAEEARALAAALDQSANARSGEALAALDRATTNP
jgi:hypothetical protein